MNTKRSTPSFTTTSIVILSLIISPMAAVVVMVVFVPDKILVGIVLLFILILLLIIIPYFALLTGLIPSATWSNTYIQIINHIPFFKRAVSQTSFLKQAKKFPTLLSSIIKRRIEAEDWKQLHEDFQNLTLKLAILSELCSGGNYEIILHDLEFNWRDSQDNLSEKISVTIKLESLREGIVKQEFINTSRQNNWLEQLSLATKNMDDIIDNCKFPQDLLINLPKFKHFLDKHEKVSNQILQFIDKRLKRAIKELDQDIENLNIIVINHNNLM